MQPKNLTHYQSLWKKVGLNWENESPHFKTRTPQKETLDFIKFLKENGINSGKALDLGCGGGRHIITFAKSGFDSYGIDFSENAINLAKLDAKDKKVKVHLKVGDVLKLPYKQNSFDIVHDTGCLHHLRKSEWKLYLENLLKVLKKDGHYKLFCFNSNTKFHLGKKISSKNNYSLKREHYTHFFTKKDIKALFLKDFKILKTIEEKRKDGFRTFNIFYMKRK